MIASMHVVPRTLIQSLNQLHSIYPQVADRIHQQWTPPVLQWEKHSVQCTVRILHMQCTRTQTQESMNSNKWKSFKFREHSDTRPSIALQNYKYNFPELHLRRCSTVSRQLKQCGTLEGLSSEAVSFSIDCRLQSNNKMKKKRNYYRTECRKLWLQLILSFVITIIIELFGIQKLYPGTDRRENN